MCSDAYGPSSDACARFQREAMAMARLNHPNVISVFAVGTVGRRFFVAMELAALVPPPKTHLVRYHGAFAPRARGRRALTGARHRIRPEELAQQLAPPAPTLGPAAPAPVPIPADGINPAADELAARPRRLPWAELFRRVHKIDVLRCTRCTGRLRILAFLTRPFVILAILSHLGLPTTLPRYPPVCSTAHLCEDVPYAISPVLRTAGLLRPPVPNGPRGIVRDPCI